MSGPGYHDALGILCHDASGDLHRALVAACESVPAWDPVVYLADFAHEVLFPPRLRHAAGRAATGGTPR
jgi:hypothetical protein